MLACSRCGKTLPKANFTSKQLKAKASARFCIACTKEGAGTLHACFSQAASRPAAERPSQVVTEKTVATTPEKQDVVVQMERLSTGGTRYEAHYERPGSGPLSDGQRKAKARARTSLFPDRVAAERAENTGRRAALRAQLIVSRQPRFLQPSQERRVSPIVIGMRAPSAVVYATRQSSTVGSVDSN